MIVSHPRRVIPMPPYPDEAMARYVEPPTADHVEQELIGVIDQVRESVPPDSRETAAWLAQS
jgi:hypothetical protein